MLKSLDLAPSSWRWVPIYKLETLIGHGYMIYHYGNTHDHFTRVSNNCIHLNDAMDSVILVVKLENEV